MDQEMGYQSHSENILQLLQNAVKDISSLELIFIEDIKWKVSWEHIFWFEEILLTKQKWMNNLRHLTTILETFQLLIRNNYYWDNQNPWKKITCEVTKIVRDCKPENDKSVLICRLIQILNHLQFFMPSQQALVQILLQSVCLVDSTDNNWADTFFVFHMYLQKVCDENIVIPRDVMTQFSQFILTLSNYEWFASAMKVLKLLLKLPCLRDCNPVDIFPGQQSVFYDELLKLNAASTDGLRAFAMLICEEIDSFTFIGVFAKLDSVNNATIPVWVTLNRLPLCLVVEKGNADTFAGTLHQISLLECLKIEYYEKERKLVLSTNGTQKIGLRPGNVSMNLWNQLIWQIDEETGGNFNLIPSDNIAASQCSHFNFSDEKVTSQYVDKYVFSQENEKSTFDNEEFALKICASPKGGEMNEKSTFSNEQFAISICASPNETGFGKKSSLSKEPRALRISARPKEAEVGLDNENNSSDSNFFRELEVNASCFPSEKKETTVFQSSSTTSLCSNSLATVCDNNHVRGFQIYPTNNVNFIETTITNSFPRHGEEVVDHDVNEEGNDYSPNHYFWSQSDRVLQASPPSNNKSPSQEHLDKIEQCNPDEKIDTRCNEIVPTDSRLNEHDFMDSGSDEDIDVLEVNENSTNHCFWNQPDRALQAGDQFLSNNNKSPSRERLDKNEQCNLGDKLHTICKEIAPTDNRPNEHDFMDSGSDEDVDILEVNEEVTVNDNSTNHCLWNQPGCALLAGVQSPSQEHLEKNQLCNLDDKLDTGCKDIVPTDNRSNEHAFMDSSSDDDDDVIQRQIKNILCNDLNTQAVVSKKGLNKSYDMNRFNEESHLSCKNDLSNKNSAECSIPDEREKSVISIMEEHGHNVGAKTGELTPGAGKAPANCKEVRNVGVSIDMDEGKLQNATDSLLKITGMEGKTSETGRCDISNTAAKETEVLTVIPDKEKNCKRHTEGSFLLPKDSTPKNIPKLSKQSEKTLPDICLKNPKPTAQLQAQKPNAGLKVTPAKTKKSSNLKSTGKVKKLFTPESEDGELLASSPTHGNIPANNKQMKAINQPRATNNSQHEENTVEKIVMKGSECKSTNNPSNTSYARQRPGFWKEKVNQMQRTAPAGGNGDYEFVDDEEENITNKHIKKKRTCNKPSKPPLQALWMTDTNQKRKQVSHSENPKRMKSFTGITKPGEIPQTALVTKSKHNTALKTLSMNRKLPVKQRISEMKVKRIKVLKESNNVKTLTHQRSKSLSVKEPLICEQSLPASMSKVAADDSYNSIPPRHVQEHVKILCARANFHILKGQQFLSEVYELTKDKFY